MSDANLQLMDGPDDVLGCYDEDALLQLARQHRLPGWYRVLHLGTMQTLTLGELLGEDPTETAATAPAHQAQTVSGSDTQTLPPDPPPLSIDPAATVPTDLSDGATAPTPQDHIPHGTVWDDMTFAQKIGQGGMGTVYKGELLTAAGPVEVAIKLLPVDNEVDTNSVRRFEREAQILASIDSNNVVKVHKFGIFEQRHYIAMELVEGKSLQETLARGYRPTAREAIDWIAQAGRGLWDSAKQGLVHRDIKPANILIDGKGCIKITDFGIARVTDSSQTALTMAGAVVGTAQYMSPEQAKAQEADHRSDIYSLGIVFYELLSGRPPFKADSVASLLMMHCEQDPEPLDRIDLPDGVNEVIRRCMAKDPAARYQSSMDLVRDLRDLLRALDGDQQARRSSAQLTTRQPPSSTTMPRPAPPSGNKGLTIGISIVLLGLIAAGGLLAWQALQEEAPVTTPPADDPKIVDNEPDRVVTTTPDPDPPPEQAAEPTDLDRYVAAVAAEDWDTAYHMAQQVWNQDQNLFRQHNLQLSLQVRSVPEGADVIFGGRQMGTCPVLLRYEPDQGPSLLVSMPGYRPHWFPRPPQGGVRQVEMAPLAALRWHRPLPATPADTILTVGNRLVVQTTNGLFVITGSGQTARLPIDADQIGPAPRIGVHAGLLYVLGRDALICLDPQSLQLRWRVGNNLIQSAKAFTPHVGTHELVAGDHKAYVSCDRRLVTFLIHAGQASPLAETTLPAAASAGPAVVQVDSALSTLFQPIGDRIVAYNGASVLQDQELEELFSVDIGQQVTVDPLPLWLDDVPCFVVCTQGGGAQLVDARAEVPPNQRRRSNWHYGRTVAWPPALVPGTSLLVAATKKHQVICVDLGDDALELWRLDLIDEEIAGPPTLTESAIVVTSKAGVLRYLDPKRGTELLRHELGLRITGPAALGATDIVLTEAQTAFGLRLHP